MARYWSHSFFVYGHWLCLLINTQKEELGQHPAILTKQASSITRIILCICEWCFEWWWVFLSLNCYFNILQRLEKQRHRCYEELRERIEREKKMQKVSEELQLQKHLMVCDHPQFQVVDLLWPAVEVNKSACSNFNNLSTYKSEVDNLIAGLIFQWKLQNLLKDESFSHCYL